MSTHKSRASSAATDSPRSTLVRLKRRRQALETSSRSHPDLRHVLLHDIRLAKGDMRQNSRALARSGHSGRPGGGHSGRPGGGHSERTGGGHSGRTGGGHSERTGGGHSERTGGGKGRQLTAKAGSPGRRRPKAVSKSGSGAGKQSGSGPVAVQKAKGGGLSQLLSPKNLQQSIKTMGSLRGQVKNWVKYLQQADQVLDTLFVTSNSLRESGVLDKIVKQKGRNLTTEDFTNILVALMNSPLGGQVLGGSGKGNSSTDTADAQPAQSSEAQQDSQRQASQNGATGQAQPRQLPPGQQGQAPPAYQGQGQGQVRPGQAQPGQQVGPLPEYPPQGYPQQGHQQPGYPPGQGWPQQPPPWQS